MSSPRHSPPPSAAAPRPKGILKNAVQAAGNPVSPDGAALDEQNRLAWDEGNLTLHEIQRQQQDPRMKIDEPKTPFVRSASVGSIADDDIAFNLDAQQASASFFPPSGPSAGSAMANGSLQPSSARPSAAELLAANTKANANAHEEANEAQNANADPADTTRSRQGSSSRSPSFTLPNSRRSSATGADRTREGVREEQHSRNSNADEIDSNAVDDDEQQAQDPESRAKQEAFARKRNAHYGNEAEAMKIAAALASGEADEEDEDDDGDEAMAVDESHPNTDSAARLPNGRA